MAAAGEALARLEDTVRQQLVEAYGFPEDRAREAASSIGDPGDIEAAVSWLLDHGEEDKGGAVQFKRCPHLDVLGSQALLPLDRLACGRPCLEGCAGNENWLCLHCGETRCGRYGRKHSMGHWQATKDAAQNADATAGAATGEPLGHCVAMGLADLSVWCYECSAYVEHDLLRPLAKQMQVLKFGADAVAPSQGSSEAGAAAAAAAAAPAPAVLPLAPKAPAPQARKPRRPVPGTERNLGVEETEAELANGGYRRPWRMFDANQTLARSGRAEVAQTSLVEFQAEATEQNVAALVRERKQGVAGRISISESWTDEALRYLRRERHPDEGCKLAALLYANCSYPGGNYSDGGMVRAQEEELCRQFPALFESLKTCEEAACTYGPRECDYGRHVFGPRLGDGYSVARNVLFTEEVQAMRAPAELSYRLLRQEANKVKAGFVAAAAPIFARGFDSDFEDFRRNPEEWYEKVFLNAFWAPKSIDPSYDVIVVGPWGCGAFGNDPQVVATSFLNVIRKHDLLHLYREIHFCMGRSLAADTTVGGACNHNVATFRQVLGTLGGEALEDYTGDLQVKAAMWLDEER